MDRIFLQKSCKLERTMILLGLSAVDSPKKETMRKRFEVSPILGSLPISEVVIPTKSRDELAPVLLALQTIFVNELYHQKMFSIVAPIILRDKKQTGRQGMSIWEVIVLSVIRLTRIIHQKSKNLNVKCYI